MLIDRTARLLGIMVYVCFVASAAAQNASMTANSRGKTSAEALQEYGIELSEPSLLVALGNSNPKVRILAAIELASARDTDAIPAIERALFDEKDPGVRVGIATALSGLHDSKGPDDLRSMCADATLPIRFVIQAVQELQMLGLSRAECADVVFASLDKDADRDYRYVVLSLLPGIYHEVPPEEADLFVSAIQKLLGDKSQDPSVRMTASQALAEIGLVSSVRVVREAILAESDPVVRASFQRDLGVLEKKQSEQQNLEKVDK